MASKKRATVAQEVVFKGLGMHSGLESSVSVKPSEPGTGIEFSVNGSRFGASSANVIETDFRTGLGAEESRVETVEHLLAALTCAGVTDATVEVSGTEIPYMDGSAALFLESLARAVQPLEEPLEPFVVNHPFTVKEGESEYHLIPSSELRLNVTIEFDHPLIGQQTRVFDSSGFSTELAPARSFGFRSDEKRLRELELIKGVENLSPLILNDSEVESGDLKWPDEFVRHKALDLLGDLSLLGRPLQAQVVAYRPGHTGNLSLVRAIERHGSHAGTMGIPEILGVLPHRYPMLLVDRIIEVETGKRIVGLKNVTFNEEFFQGHFPGHPVMPGVLIVEAMAQAGGMLLMDDVDDPDSKVVYFMSIDNVKFRRPVVPGDQLRFELEMIQFRGKTCRMRGVAYVDGRPVAEAEMMARIMDK